ncbi:MAG: HesA/MoeB/ThiF family protein [Leptospirales bacterium]
MSESRELHARQMTLPGWEETFQERLAKSTVFIAGVGGIGGVVAQYLAMGGVGEIVLVHDGPLELPDLNRQTLMDREGIGKSRVETAAGRIRSQIPECRIRTVDGRISPALSDLVRISDLLVDARTNFEERFLLNRMAREHKKPLLFAAMNGMEGLLALLRPGVGACLECIFPEGDPAWDPLGFPVLGSVSGTVGSLAATLAIRVLAGYGQKEGDRMLVFDGMDLSLRRLSLVRNRACAACKDDTKKTGRNLP